eukprot:gene5812-6939_t
MDEHATAGGAPRHLARHQPPQLMDIYIHELRELVARKLPVDAARLGVFGHSMGGHGALTLALKRPDGLGTDGTRVSSYGPWPSVYWAVTGKTAGGLSMWQPKDILSRFEALKLMTSGSAWMSGEEKLKGTLAKGQYADLVILPQDYFSMPVEQIKNLESALTVVNGKVVYAGKEFG